MHTYIIYMCIGKLNGILRSHMNIDGKLSTVKTKTLSHIFEVEFFMDANSTEQNLRR